MDSGSERFLTVADVTRLTGLSERTVRAMVSDGRLPAIRPHGVRVVRVPAAAVRALMGSRATPPREPEED